MSCETSECQKYQEEVKVAEKELIFQDFPSHLLPIIR